MPEELRHFDGSFAEVVTLRDGVPVRYASLAAPPPPEGEPALAARIAALVGVGVRLGEWVELQGDPRDGGAEVPLFVAPRGFDEAGALDGLRLPPGALAVIDPESFALVALHRDVALDLRLADAAALARALGDGAQGVEALATRIVEGALGEAVGAVLADRACVEALARADVVDAVRARLAAALPASLRPAGVELVALRLRLWVSSDDATALLRARSER
ncbi:MAG TPA: hypothetical protein VHB21_01115 [Minicystis sp.]|nr:hypothetical protein [Minicystis sp.]